MTWFAVLRLSALAFLAALPTLSPVARAESATYVFQRIADSTGAAFQDASPATVFDGGVAINDGGVVAFGSRACGGGIFAGAGGLLSRIACNDALRGTGLLVPAGAAPAIDATGTVAFFALADADSYDDRAGAIVVVSRGVATVVARSSAADPGSAASRVLPSAPSISGGAVALIGEIAPVGHGAGVFLHDGRALGLLAPQPAVRTVLGMSGAAAILGPRADDPASLAIFLVHGGSTTLLVDRVDEPGAELAMDERGRVAFATSAGAFVADGAAVWRLAGTTTFEGFEPSGIGIDRSGRAAFIARLSPSGSGRGIFTGPDPILDRVIATGDPLAGSIVVDLVLATSRSIAMNASGQIAFVAHLADGRTAVVRADPVVPPVAGGDPDNGTGLASSPGTAGAAIAPADGCATCAGTDTPAATTARATPRAASPSAPTLTLASTISVSGTLYADEGVTPMSGSLRLALGGATAFIASAGANGQFTFSGIAAPAAGTVLTVWVDNTPGKSGAVVTRYAGAGDVAGLDVYLERLIVRHDDAGPLTNSDLRACSKTTGTACSDTDLRFTVAATSLALTLDKTWMLYVWPATTFAPGGNVTLAAGTPSAAPGGDLKLGATTSVLNVGTRALTVGGDWDNTAGGTFVATGNQLVTFTGVGAGFRLSGLMTGASSFQKVLFKSPTGTWTIRDPMRVGSTASDALKITNGSVTLGDGPGDDLELLGGLKIVPASGATASLQVTLLPPGQRITIDLNARSMPTCSTCKIVVGGTTGQGILRLNRSSELRLNARAAAPASDAGIEVESTGYLEIQGSLDDSGVAAAPTGTTTLSDPGKVWSPGQHDGKVLRISNLSSLAFGRVYRITGTTATALLRADTSSAPGTIATVTGAGASRTVCLDHAGVIAADRKDVGRYLEVRSPGAGHLKVVHSVNDDPSCPGGTDSVVVIGEPDALWLAASGATVAIVDGVRAGDTYEIISPAEIGADTGPACASVVGGAGAAYLWAKQGSETVIRWAHICNVGRQATHRDGLVFESVNGANTGEGATITGSWIHLAGRYAVNLSGARNNAGPKGISDNFIATTGSYGIVAAASASNNAIIRNRIFDSTNAVSLEASSTNHLVGFNHLHGGRTLNGNSVHNAGGNNTLLYNQLYGNQSNGLRLTKSARSSWIYGNEIFGNGDAGVSAESSQGTTLFANRIHANGAGVAVSVADATAPSVAGFRSISDLLGLPADNRFGDVGYGGGGAHAAVFYRTRFGSATDARRVARSGNIGNGQSTSMSRVVTGPGTLSLDWAVSSERGYDKLTLAVNGVAQAAISGAQRWAPLTVALPSGPVTIRFTYSKDSTDAHGLDAGMVDNVRVDGTSFDFESGGLAGWTLEGAAAWRNTARIESVSGVAVPEAYALARRPDDTAGLTRLYGHYRIPAQVVETPQDETVETFAFVDQLWGRSATVHGYRGTGTEDPNLDYDLAGANLAGGPYHYRAAVTTGGPCASAVFAVTRNGADVGTAACGQSFTDVVGGVNVTFRIDGGGAAAYAVGDTYAFVVWDGSGDGSIGKQLVLQQDGDRLSVPLGTRLVLRGESPGTNVTTVTRGSTGGYQVVVDGTIDANAYAFEHLGGTGQPAGLVLNGSATILSLDHGAFDRFAVPAAGATAFVQVDAALIGSGTPARELVGVRFDNATGFATCNLNAIGTATGFWQITATGTFAGEGHDCAAGVADDTPGRFAW